VSEDDGPSSSERFVQTRHFDNGFAHLEVHPVLEQFAVADVDRLRDHVGVRVLRVSAVEQAGGHGGRSHGSMTSRFRSREF
jgi:hypothetical protein